MKMPSFWSHDIHSEQFVNCYSLSYDKTRNSQLNRYVGDYDHFIIGFMQLQSKAQNKNAYNRQQNQ